MPLNLGASWMAFIGKGYTCSDLCFRLPLKSVFCHISVPQSAPLSSLLPRCLPSSLEWGSLLLLSLSCLLFLNTLIEHSPGPE